MATFKEIRGQLIKKYTTNPADPLEGQMWYNNTTGTLKGVVVTEAWSSGNPTINEQKQSYGTGIQTAALCGQGEDSHLIQCWLKQKNIMGRDGVLVELKQRQEPREEVLEHKQHH